MRRLITGCCVSLFAVLAGPAIHAQIPDTVQTSQGNWVAHDVLVNSEEGQREIEKKQLTALVAVAPYSMEIENEVTRARAAGTSEIGQLRLYAELVRQKAVSRELVRSQLEASTSQKTNTLATPVTRSTRKFKEPLITGSCDMDVGTAPLDLFLDQSSFDQRVRQLIRGEVVEPGWVGSHQGDSSLQ